MSKPEGKTPRWIVYSVDGSVLDGPFANLRAARRSAKHAGDVAGRIVNERNGAIGWSRFRLADGVADMSSTSDDVHVIAAVLT